MTRSNKYLIPKPVIGMTMADSLERFLHSATINEMAADSDWSESQNKSKLPDTGIEGRTMTQQFPLPKTQWSRDEMTKQWVYDSNDTSQHPAITATHSVMTTPYLHRQFTEGNDALLKKQTFRDHAHTVSGVEVAARGSGRDPSLTDPDFTHGGYRTDAYSGRITILRDSSGKLVIVPSKASATVTKSEACSSLHHEQVTDSTGPEAGPSLEDLTSQQSASSTSECFRPQEEESVKASKGKEVLKKHILLRNPQMQRAEPKEIKEEKLDSEDEKKRSRRRERNRQAAQRCRLRKTVKAESLFKTYQDLECSNTEIRYQIRQLERERDKLNDILVSHQQSTATCHLPQKK